jgi:Leucine-rich repeat (LRR) protein
MLPLCRPARIAVLAIACIVPALASRTPAMAQDAPAVVLFEDPALSADRLHYPVIIAGGRGYRILCSSQADEESVIHGLGFTTVSTIMSAVDPAIVAAAPSDNPKLCPTGPTYTIKVFAAEGPGGLKHYLQFPADFNSPAFADRLYVPGCLGLVQALKLDLSTAQNADPTPFFVGKIHEISCLNGEDIPTIPDSFTDWCIKGDRTPAETATVMALLDATPGGITALGSASACASAETFLRQITTLNLNGKGVQSLAPLSVLPQLTSLSLASNEITDIGPLEKLATLAFLDLRSNKVANLTTLSRLTSLTRLTLSDNNITDIRAISALTLLTNLALDNNAVADLTPLQFLSALSTLSLAGNGLTGAMLEPLTALGALTSLDLSNNQIEDFEHLGALPSVLDIDLTGNPIVSSGGQSFLDLCILHRDAATPYGQTIRTILDLNGGGTCQAGSDAVMATTSLDLSSKIISDIRPLAVLTHLTNLNLASNAITDISPLSGLTQITELTLTDNGITDIRPLAPLKSLISFDASGNPVALPDFLSACLMRNHQDFLSHEQQVEVDAMLGVSGQSNCKLAVDDLSQRKFADFRNRGLTSLAYFKLMHDLEAIDLSGNGLNDVAGLQSLPALTRIIVRDNNIASVNSFRPMRGLEQMFVDGNPLASLVGIQDLSKLKRLHFSNTNVRSVIQLADLPLLETAEMRNLPLSFANFREYCIVNRFDPISLGAVRSFMLAVEARLDAAHVDRNDCAAAEAWVMAQTVLTLNKKQISDLAPIVFFTALKELHLFDNLVSDVTPVASLRNLQKLNLAKNRVAAMPRLASTGLRELYLNDNLVTDVGLLTNLHALTTITLRDNRVGNPAPLAALPALSTIDLRGNRIVAVELALPIAPKSYLGDNPVCQLIIAIGATPTHPLRPFVPIIDAACKRVPLPVLHDIGILHGDLTVLQPEIPSVNCGSPGAICPQIHIRPFGGVVNQ